jgi:hypothetical protein
MVFCFFYSHIKYLKVDKKFNELVCSETQAHFFLRVLLSIEFR